MDTRRTGNCSVLLYLAAACVLLPAAGRTACADSETATAALIATYRGTVHGSNADTEQINESLRNILADCPDPYVASRITYRVGILYFKAGMMESSAAAFRELTADPNCGQVLRACALNMIAQISRLRGENDDALDAFEQLAALSAQHVSEPAQAKAGSVFARLLRSALAGRAEILQLKGDYAMSIAEYNRLLGTLKLIDAANDANDAASVIDRIAQLHLRRGDIDGYTDNALLLVRDYPQYRRAQVVELEAECVRWLNDFQEDFELPNGSFAAPAMLVDRLRSADAGAAVQPLLAKLERICRNPRKEYAAGLLRYHYAWFLDAVGEQDKAAEVLTRLLSAPATAQQKESPEQAVLHAAREYARIQRAIILGEKARYAEAVRVLSGLETHPDGSHIAELARSVLKSIETLRREVPNVQKTKG